MGRGHLRRTKREGVMSDKTGVMEKQAILTNLPGGKDETKAAPRVLTELESSKIEILNLTQQALNFKQEVLNGQKKVLAVQEENLKLQKDLQAKETEKVLLDLGLSGSVNLSKNDDGRYVVNPGK